MRDSIETNFDNSLIAYKKVLSWEITFVRHEMNLNLKLKL